MAIVWRIFSLILFFMVIGAMEKYCPRVLHTLIGILAALGAMTLLWRGVGWMF